jgi:nitrite reductase (NADH) small subunit
VLFPGARDNPLRLNANCPLLNTNRLLARVGVLASDMSFVRLTDTANLPAPNEAKEIACGDKMICVANVGGQFLAVDNVCVHLGGPLGEGVVDKGKIVCPWHGWAYDLKTGELAPGRPGVKPYALKIENGDVLIET